MRRSQSNQNQKLEQARAIVAEGAVHPRAT